MSIRYSDIRGIFMQIYPDAIFSPSPGDPPGRVMVGAVSPVRHPVEHADGVVAAVRHRRAHPPSPERSDRQAGPRPRRHEGPAGGDDALQSPPGRSGRVRLSQGRCSVQTR